VKDFNNNHWIQYKDDYFLSLMTQLLVIDVSLKWPPYSPLSTSRHLPRIARPTVSAPH